MSFVRRFATWRARCARADRDLFSRALALAFMRFDMDKVAEFRASFDEADARVTKWSRLAGEP